MADVNANIGVHIDTSAALAELKNLQRQLANFHSSVSKSSASAAIAQKNLQTNLLNSINATGKFRAQMGLVRTSTESFTHALETNKLSMREYFRYAGGSTRTFGKLFKQEFNTIGRVAEERVKKMQTQYIKMGRDASGAMKAISITPNTLNMKDYSTKLAVAAQKQALLNQLLKQGSTNLLNFGKNTQWAGRQLMVGFTIPLAYFGTAAAKTFMDLEKQAIRFKRVYGDMFTTTDETNKALADVQKLAEEFTKYGVAVTKTMEMAASAAAMGKTGADLTAQVAQATRLAVLGGVEQEQALETTISVTNAFGIAADELANKINFLNAVENQTVVSIEDLTEAIPKAGPVVKQLGGSVEDLAFFLTAMKEGGINASEGANALKSGLASLINPTEKASKMLASMGINIKAIVEGNAGNIKETVIDFAQALDTLDPLNRARAIEQLFGKFQFSRLSTLFQNVTKDGTQAARVLDLAGASIEELAILSERELGVLEDAVGTNFRESVEKLKLTLAPIGKTFLEAVTPIVQVVGRLLDKFNNLGDGTKKFIVIATTLVGVIGPVLLMTFGLLLNAGANIIKLFAAMRNGFLRAGTNSNLLAQQTQYLSSEQLEAATVAASLNQAHTRLTQSFSVEAAAVRLLRQAYIDATIAATNFARANPGMMMPGGKFTPKKFASGVTEVPGTGNKDTVASMLTPGEAVIPKGVAQDPRFRPIIDAMVNGTLQGFGGGSTGVTFDGKTYNAQTASKAKNVQNFLASLTTNDGGKTYNYVDPKNPSNNKAGIPVEKISSAMLDRSSRGKLDISEIKKDLVLTADARKSNAATKGPGQKFVSDKLKQLPGKGMSGTEKEISAIKERLKKYGFAPDGKEMKRLLQIDKSHLTPTFDASGKKVFTLGNIMPDYGYVNNYISNSLKNGKLGKHLSAMSSKQLKSLGIDPTEFRSLMAGNHPQTTASAKTLSQISQYVLNYPGGEKALGKALKLDPAGVRNLMYQTDAVNAGLSERLKTDFYKGGAGSRTISSLLKKANVAVSKGELLIDEKNRASIVTGSTGKPKPANMPMIGGSKKDTRTLPALKVGRVIPKPGFKGPGSFAIGADAGLINNSVAKPGSGFKMGNVAPNMRVADTQLQQLITALNANAQATTKLTEPTKQNAKDLKREQRAQRAQRVGSVAGPVAGLAGMGAMAGFMTGNNNLGMGMMAVSGIASIAPMLTNPIGIAVAAAATLAGGFLLLNKRMSDARKKQIEYIDSISASTKKMQKVGELTGKVGASQIAQRQRETGTRVNQFRTGFDSAGNEFGTNFLASDIGKQIFKGFNDSVVKDGDKAAKLLATQLAAYISDGVLSAEQANSIARAIGINLGDMSVSTDISGELREIIGPDGQDILKNPLKVRLQIVTEQSQNTKDIINELKKNVPGSKDRSQFVSAAAASATKDLQVIQAQRDAQYQTNQTIIDNLEKQKATTTDKTKQLELENQISIAKTKQKTEDTILAEKSKQSLKNTVDTFNAFSTGDYDRQNYIKTLRDSIKINQKDNPFLKPFLEAGSALKNESLEVQIYTAVEGGLLNISTSKKLIEMFAGTEGGEEKLKKIIETTVTAQDPGVFQAFMDIVSGKPIKPEIIMNILSDQENFEDRINVLNKLKDYDGDVINLGVMINELGLKGLDQLAKDFNIIEKIKGPITLDVVNNIKEITSDPDLNMSGLVKIWDKYKNATDEIKKTVIQEYIAIYKSVGDKEVQNFIQNEINKGTFGQADPTGKLAQQIINKYKLPDGSINTSLIQAEIASDLMKQKGVGEPNKIPGGGLDGGGGERPTYLDELLKRLKLVRDASINARGGIEELRRVMLKSGGDLKIFKGINQQLRDQGINQDFIDFVSDLDPEIQKKFISIKNGIVKITEDGKDLAAGLNEAIIGELQDGYNQQIQGLKAQSDKFIELKAAGLSAAEALSVVTNEQVALALASGKTKEEIDTVIDGLRRLRAQEEETLKTIDPAKSVEKEVSMALEYYDVLERETKNIYQPQIDAINNLIDANEKLIDVKQREIEINYDRPIALLNAQSTILNHDLSLIDKAAESINKKYDEQEKALSQISEINDQIAAQEKRRITIADALTQGDISAAAKAIQEERQAAAQAAQDRNSNLLQAAREKELAALRSSSGLTRLQIEEKLYDISEQVYALEQKQIPLLNEIKKLQDDNYNYQVNSLAPLQAKLDKELAAIDAQRKKWNDIQLGVDGARVRSQEYQNVLLNIEETLKRMKALWDEIGKASSKSLMLTVPQNASSLKGVDTIASNISSTVSNMSPEIIASKYISAAQAEQYLVDQAITAQGLGPKYAGMLKGMFGMASGGMVPKYYVSGGYSKGTDTIPAMLTPGEFVVRKNAVDSFGINNLNKINDGSYGGSSVYNYNLNVNVKSESNPDDIARTVMTQIRQIDNQRIRTQRGA